MPASRGPRAQAFAPSGPSSGTCRIDGRRVARLRLSAESRLDARSGAIVVCAEGTCMLDMALNSVRFFRNESCASVCPAVWARPSSSTSSSGRARRGEASDYEMIRDLSEAMRLRPFAPGQIAPAPVQSVIAHSPTRSSAHPRANVPVGRVPEWPSRDRFVRVIEEWNEPTASDLVHLTIDGRPIEVAPGRRSSRRPPAGIEIPPSVTPSTSACRSLSCLRRRVKNARVWPPRVSGPSERMESRPHRAGAAGPADPL